MTNTTNLDPFEGMSESKKPQVKFGKVGDWFKGTLVDNTRELPNKLSVKKEMQKVYEFKMQGGSFHGIKETAPGRYDPEEQSTEIQAGEYYSYIGKEVIQSQMRNAKIGQIIGMRFAEEKPPTTPGYSSTKIIKVYLGEMDSEYKGENSDFEFN